MKPLAPLILVLAGLCCGCSREAVVTPSQFTIEFAEALQKAAPTLKVEIVNDLEVRSKPSTGNYFTSYLNNAYDLYKQDPNTRAEVIQRLVASTIEIVSSRHPRVDGSKIVPVIKDRPWLEETRKELLDRGAKETPEYVFHDLNTDLVILYAEDSPKSIRYLTPKDLEEAKISRGDLRSLATGNLKRIIPKIEKHGANGLYMLTAGGDYEASLLLFDSMWSSGQIKVKGKIVVGVPTRDMLVVTGSEDEEGLAKARQMVSKIYEEGSYRLTPKLFVYQDGKFSAFEGK